MSERSSGACGQEEGTQEAGRAHAEAGATAQLAGTGPALKLLGDQRRAQVWRHETRGRSSPRVKEKHGKTLPGEVAQSSYTFKKDNLALSVLDAFSLPSFPNFVPGPI